ncbi:MAG: Exo-beta-D-glucosaminidase precursor, partial [Planctomycetota bacterium]
MNDAWTGHSWSLVDVQGRAKPAWHAVRESCAPRMLTIHQRDGAWVVDAVNDSPIAWKSRVCLLKCANMERADLSTDLREYFLEGFTV